MPLRAQTIWVEHDLDRGVWLEALKAGLEGRRLSIGSSVFFATLRWPLRRDLHLILDVPAAHAALDGTPIPGSTTMGQPYVGFEVSGHRSRLLLDAGVRVPAFAGRPGSDLAHYLGHFAAYDRPEAFNADYTVVSVLASLNGGQPALRLRAMAGASGLLATGRGVSGVLLHYAGEGGVLKGDVLLSVVMSGRLRVAGSGDVGMRSTQQVGIRARVLHHRTSPALLFRVPVGDDLPLDYVLGFALGVPFE